MPLRRSLSPLVGSLALLVAGCGGPAAAATHAYGITDYDRLRIEGPFDVRVKVGGPPGARATGPQEAIDRLSVEQHDDVLVIRPMTGGWGGWPNGFHGKLLIELSAPMLTAATLGGSGAVTIDRVKGDAFRLTMAGSGSLAIGTLDVTQLGAALSGSGDLTLAGRARQASATATGSGDLHADQLATDDVTVNLVGSGNVAIGAIHEAKINLVGAGDVTIVGPATCAVTRTGSGDVHCAHLSGGN